MSVKKQFLKTKPVCKVTFSLSKEETGDVNDIKILGAFNDWDVAKGVQMKKFKNGNFKATVDLELEKEYEFKYLINGETWKNDETADKFVSNGISWDGNSVLVL